MWRRRAGLAIAAVLAAGGPALAHHSTAMYDKTREVTLTGVVADYQWTNPHVWIEIDTMSPGGGWVRYSIEGNSPRALSGLGWKVRSLAKGDAVVLVINPLRNGEKGGQLVKATLPDGRSLAG